MRIRAIACGSVKCRVTLDIFASLRNDKGMEFESISYKGMRRFVETGNPKGLVGDTMRVRKMLAFIDAATNF